MTSVEDDAPVQEQSRKLRPRGNVKEEAMEVVYESDQGEDVEEMAEEEESDKAEEHLAIFREGVSKLPLKQMARIKGIIGTKLFNWMYKANDRHNMSIYNVIVGIMGFRLFPVDFAKLVEECCLDVDYEFLKETREEVEKLRQEINRALKQCKADCLRSKIKDMEKKEVAAFVKVAKAFVTEIRRKNGVEIPIKRKPQLVLVESSDDETPCHVRNVKSEVAVESEPMTSVEDDAPVQEQSRRLRPRSNIKQEAMEVVYESDRGEDVDEMPEGDESDKADEHLAIFREGVSKLSLKQIATIHNDLGTNLFHWMCFSKADEKYKMPLPKIKKLSEKGCLDVDYQFLKETCEEMEKLRQVINRACNQYEADSLRSKIKDLEKKEATALVKAALAFVTKIQRKNGEEEVARNEEVADTVKDHCFDDNLQAIGVTRLIEMLREGNLRLGTLHKQLDEAVKAGASDEAGRLSMEIRELNEKNSETALMIEIREANNKRLSSEKQEKRRERRRKKMLVEQSIKAGNKLKKLNKGIRKASTTIRKVNEKNSKKTAAMAEIRRDNSEQMRSEQQPALLRETEVEHLVNRLVEKKIEQLKSEGRLEKKTGGNAQIAVKTEPQFDGKYGCQ